MTENFEFRMVPLDQLHESQWNTRKHFDDKKFEELLGSVVRVGVLTPLLARPNADGFEIAAGHRRFKAAKKAGLKELPVRIRLMTDAEFLEIVTIENLQREDLHPLDEALGYQALMKKAGYDVPAIAAKVGKSESYVYQRLKLADLIEPAKKLFFEEEITAGHAILIARLEPKDQEEALGSCFDRWRKGLDGKPIMNCSVRELNGWIQNNLHLDLHAAPFKKEDADLVPAAGACVTCPKRTGFVPQLFPDIAKKDTCTDRACFQAKTKAHVARKKSELEAEGTKLVEISTGYASYNEKNRKDAPLYSDKYSRIAGKKDRCESAQKAIVVEGSKDLGHVVDICRNPKCKVHHGGSIRGQYGNHLGNARERNEQRRKEEKARNETTLRLRILDGILAIGRKEPSTEDLRLIAMEFWGRTFHDNQKLIANRRGWDVSAKKHQYSTGHDYSGAGKKVIAAAEASELVSMLLEFSLIADTSVGVYDVSDKKQLLETAKRYKVDVKSIEKKFAAELAEKKSKKAARKKKAKASNEAALKKVVGELHGCAPAETKAPKAGTKSANAETNSTKRKTNGAESETPAPFHVRVHPKPRKGEHACGVCGCTESSACEGGCAWSPEFLQEGRYICTDCVGQEAPPTTKRKSRKPQTSATEASV